MKTMLHLLAVILLSGQAYSQGAPFPEDRFEMVESYLREQQDLSGVFVLGQQGKVRLSMAFGDADRKAGRPFTENTLSTIGSITKPFTATAILLLEERGKLSVNDKLTNYFNNVPKDKENITLHHLLTHSAGFPGAIGSDFEALDKDGFIKRAFAEALLFEPGTAYEYSNVGYSILGIILEKVTGQSYSDFMAENIFKPAGMETAGYHNPKADYTQLAHGYWADGRDWGTLHDKTWDGKEPYWNLKANGGLMMSAKDMYQWYLALRHHKILKPETLKKQITPYVDEGGGGSYYGYGYAIFNNGESIEHNGGNPVFSADFRWYPKADAFLFSATNDANVRLFRHNEAIVHILKTGERPATVDWQETELTSISPAPKLKTVQSFIDLLQHHQPAKATAFIDTHCSPGVIERNGKEKLMASLERLSHDIQQQPVKAIFTAGERVKLVIENPEQKAVMFFTIGFKDNQFDSLSVEMEGM